MPLDLLPGIQESAQQRTGSQHKNASNISQTHHLTPTNAADEVLNSDPSDIPSLEFGNVPPFTETEDFLQYLLTLPLGWPTSLSAGVSPETVGDTCGVVPNLDDNGQHPEHTDETSPRAVLQMNAMITDMVRKTGFWKHRDSHV